MMTFDNETNITGMSTSSLHQEQPNTSISSVSPCMDHPQQPEHQQSKHELFSVLHGSLRPIILKFEDVAYCIISNEAKRSCFSSAEPKPAKPILNGVSGIVRPGELLGMLGPSGSGKTTLLTAIAGRLAGRLAGKLTGAITYNGQSFSSSVMRQTGFVTQDDVLYPHLTVFETLAYAALLRLPKQLTKQEKLEQAELVIAELRLSRCRHSVVGGSRLRGVSGGERKRVSIGQEMLVNPSLLLLDEPTSGLDSTTAQRIVATLKGLARGGRTVVTTVHQPSSRLYMMFDKVVVLSDGFQVYFGESGKVMEYFESIGFFPASKFVNPADFLLDLASGASPENQDDLAEFHGRLLDHDDQNSTKQVIISSYRKNQYPVLKDHIHQTYSVPTRASKRSSVSRSSESQWTTTWWTQFKVLVERGLKERKHESYSGLRVFQVLTVSILCGLLWWHSDRSHIQDQVGLLFFFSIFWGFFPLFNATFAFSQEWPMLVREHSSGMYRLSSYYAARTVGDLPMELVLPTIFVTIAYWMGGLKHSLVSYSLTLLIILFNVLVSQGLGLALGSLIMDVKHATTLASVTMLVFLLAGGYYIQQIPPFVAWLKYISFSHYCYKLLVGVQYSENEVFECGIGVHCKAADFPAIKYLGIGDLGWDVAALTVMLVGYRVLAYLALRLREQQH